MASAHTPCVSMKDMFDMMDRLDSGRPAVSELTPSHSSGGAARAAPKKSAVAEAMEVIEARQQSKLQRQQRQHRNDSGLAAWSPNGIPINRVAKSDKKGTGCSENGWDSRVGTVKLGSAGHRNFHPSDMKRSVSGWFPSMSGTLSGTRSSGIGGSPTPPADLRDPRTFLARAQSAPDMEALYGGGGGVAMIRSSRLNRSSGSEDSPPGLIQVGHSIMERAPTSSRSTISFKQNSKIMELPTDNAGERHEFKGSTSGFLTDCSFLRPGFYQKAVPAE